MTRTTVEKKWCTRCGRRKPLDAFTRNSHHSDGRHSRCRECTRSFSRNKWVSQKQDLREVDRRATVGDRGEGPTELLLRDLLRRGMEPDAVPFAAALVVGLDEEARTIREAGAVAA